MQIEISKITKRLLDDGLIMPEDSSVIVYDLQKMEEQVSRICRSFPETTLHSIAIKANPLIGILKYLKKMNTGLEAASLPELEIALKLDYASDKIVFDSPVKTIPEIIRALEMNVHINIDSYSELHRVETIRKSLKSKSKIGVRINPQVGVGSIKATSVADHISKFGIPIKNNRKRLTEVFMQHEWLTRLHIHIGSQGMSPEILIDSIVIVYQLAEDINNELIKQNKGPQIDSIDIGGGYPVNYNTSDDFMSFETFIEKLKLKVPKLFTDYKIITEYGRFIHAKTGFALSRVEYVKNFDNSKIIMTHLGADFMLRKAYNPGDWHHKITVLDQYGNEKTNTSTHEYNIAGPLCFAGDFIAKNIILPEINEGDFLVIHDIGAYTLSMWSRYNSRQIPKIIGYSNDYQQIIKERETPEQLASFWA